MGGQGSEAVPQLEQVRQEARPECCELKAVSHSDEAVVVAGAYTRWAAAPQLQQ